MRISMPVTAVDQYLYYKESDYKTQERKEQSSFPTGGDARSPSILPG